MSRSSSLSGIRITKAGLWFVLFALIVGVAATNTGNNALYMALSAMLALLTVSEFASRNNLRGLRAEIFVPREIYAQTPARVEFRVASESRFVSRWLLQASVDRNATPAVVPFLSRRGGRQPDARVDQTIQWPKRGRFEIDGVEIASLFPMGFFRKARVYFAPTEVLVYPRLLTDYVPPLLTELPVQGEDRSPDKGRGHDLRGLRTFREGDDPRDIHWKHTARIGTTVVKERHVERALSVSLVLDNTAAQGRESEAFEEAFERSVSEVATAALRYLDRGFEVELLARGYSVGLGRGERQKAAVLRCLAELRTEPAEEVSFARGGATTARVLFRPEVANGDLEGPSAEVLKYPQRTPAQAGGAL